jgi:hypothetical protein
MSLNWLWMCIACTHQFCTVCIVYLKLRGIKSEWQWATCFNFVYSWVTDLNCRRKLWRKSILCFSTYVLYATLFSVIVFAELLVKNFIVYIHSDVGTLVLLLPLFVPIVLPFLIYLHIYNYHHIFHYCCYCCQYYYPKLFFHGALLFIVSVIICFSVATYTSPLLLVWKISDNTFALHPYWLLFFLRKGSGCTRSPYCHVFLYICVPVFLLFNQLTNFHTIYYRHYARSPSTSYFLTFRRQILMPVVSLYGLRFPV